MVIVCTGPQGETARTMDRRDARIGELNNLRLALAAFALQLAAFEMRLQNTTLEMRMNRGPLRAGAKPGFLVPPQNYRLQASEGKTGQWSIRSLGKRPDT
jgi:hypothetical protein